MEHLPFSIKVEAVIVRANGDQEFLGAIGSTALREENEHSIDISDKK
jgi:hypothetical protein